MYIEWGASISGITAVYLYGEKSNVAPYFGLLAQVVWLMLTIMMQIWGILIFNGVMMLLHFRNIFRMREISSLPAVHYKLSQYRAKSKKKVHQK
tara:strand:+ start:774 stop:1055 length:282 start_codon:yes stop_codon:yes gene_type:complete